MKHPLASPLAAQVCLMLLAACADRVMAQSRPIPLAHETFTALLSRCVHSGVVDYALLRQQESALDACIATLGSTDPGLLAGDSLKAFWINAYNAFTLKLILEQAPDLRSIKDISSGERWDAERWLVHGRRYSLDTIEHKLLRPLGDPRIHFAIVCASRSCPDLQSDAYEAATLDEQLDRVTRAFLADTTKGLRFETEPGVFYGENQRLYLSALFDWFGEDFSRDGASKIDFVLRHAPQPAVDFIRAHRDDLSIRWLDYDWSLNDR